MDDEQKPNPLLLGPISQTHPPKKTSRGEAEQANKTVRKRKTPLWMSDYLINYNGETEYSSTNTIPTLPDSGLKRKAPEQFHSHQSPSPSTSKKMVVENLSCQPCQISCSGIIALKQHLAGRQHKAKLEYGKLNTCDVCQIWCSDRDGLEMHFKGQKHKAKLKQLEVNGGDKGMKTPIMCELCLVYCTNEDLYEMHLKGKKHATREELKRRGIDSRAPSALYTQRAKGGVAASLLIS